MSFSPDFLCAAVTLGLVFFVIWYLWSLLWGTVPFTAKARQQKEQKIVLGAARTFLLSYEDLPDYCAEGKFAVRMNDLRVALEAEDVPTCKSLLEFLDPPKSWAAGREWLDILVVSISVAMAFRAYFYEPFNIPTGSMQPTLYGNHSVACSPEEADFFDKTPLKWLKWMATGAMYEHFKAPFDGVLRFKDTGTGFFDMRVRDRAGNISRPMLIPTDVLRGMAGDAPELGMMRTLANGLTDGSHVRAGDTLWSGKVVTGDFLFVNRWLWNFRHPRRGDVMIFSTTGIKGLQQGTHYIKRMTGTPGETLTIKDGHLVVDGTQPMEPLRVRQIQNREKWHEKEPAYAGYRPPPMPPSASPDGLTQFGPVTLKADEYFACGDNSRNSYDSRYWGPVPAANLRGIAGGVFWPIWNHRWGRIK